MNWDKRIMISGKISLSSNRLTFLSRLTSFTSFPSSYSLSETLIIVSSASSAFIALLLLIIGITLMAALRRRKKKKEQEHIYSVSFNKQKH